MLDGISLILMGVTLVLFLIAIIGLFQRNGTAIKRFKRAGISFVAFFTVLVISVLVEPTSKEVDSKVTNDNSSEETNVEKEKKIEEENKAEKEKADAEAKKKAEEEKKKIAEAKAKKKENKIGTPVKVGDFEYVILAAKEENVLESNDQFTENIETEGKFVMIDYSVKNFDNKARMVDKNLFTLKDKKGNQYDPFSHDDLYAILGDSNLFYEEVNPGLSRKGKIVFEIPSEVTEYSLELSSGIGWSGGKYKTINLK
ncbi:DUF4352 domain-containing protein [[Brevibacterium] frigoritolerans]|nr:DUF4352 domain-containing protein [Peribacillus frigoritolerans]